MKPKADFAVEHRRLAGRPGKASAATRPVGGVSAHHRGARPGAAAPAPPPAWRSGCTVDELRAQLDDLLLGICCIERRPVSGRSGAPPIPARGAPRMTTARPFRGFRFPAEVILWAMRWYLQFSISYRDLEAMLADRGAAVDHVSLYRWV
jgi:hypothetical protein